MVAPWLVQTALYLSLAGSPDAATNTHLRKANDLYEAMRYPEAEKRLRIARGSPNLSNEERRNITDLLARAIIAQGRAAEAETLYSELLAEDPLTPDPPDASPKILETFLRAKKKLFPPGTAQLVRLPAPATTLRFRSVDPWKVVSKVVLQKATGPGPFTPSVLSAQDGEFQAVIAGDGRAHRAYVEARSVGGELLAQLGSADAPLLLGAPVETLGTKADVAPAPTGPRRWPAYLAAGASVAALAVGVGMAISSGNDSAAAAQSTVARDIRTLDGRAQGKAVVANVLIGAAVLGGAGTAYLFWNF
jgi:hypothetical protein